LKHSTRKQVPQNRNLLKSNELGKHAFFGCPYMALISAGGYKTKPGKGPTGHPSAIAGPVIERSRSEAVPFVRYWGGGGRGKVLEVFGKISREMRVPVPLANVVWDVIFPSGS
jgi:hypothetical protein